MSTYWDWDGQEPLSEVTLAALVDMGFVVDLSQADRYAVPEGPQSPQARLPAVGSCARRGGSPFIYRGSESSMTPAQAGGVRGPYRVFGLG